MTKFRGGWWQKKKKEIEKGKPRKSLCSSWQKKKSFPEGSIGQLWQIPPRDQVQEEKKDMATDLAKCSTVMWP